MRHIACHSSMDCTSLFLLQNDPHTHGFNPLDMVGPFSCNGDTTIGSEPAVAANSQARRSNDERKRRRLASNRESARRSRTRKRRRLDELSLRVAHLRATNQRLLVELNHMIGKHARMVHENAKLREEAAGLQKRLDEMEVEEAQAATRRTPKLA